VREGYLVDFDVVSLKSEVRIGGVFLKEGEKVGVVDTTTGVEQMDMLEDEREFDASDVERKVTSPDSNRKILEEVSKYAQEHQARYGGGGGGGRDRRDPSVRAQGEKGDETEVHPRGEGAGRAGGVPAGGAGE
jgi:hypothetical protein